ncbi:MAG: VWA domain-containing protein [Cyanobacteria bacterium P01_G01_bin.49]
MLNPCLKPHRNKLKANTTEEQKLFVMLKVIPQAEIAKTRSSLALALVIDTSSSMQEYADQIKAEKEIKMRGLQGQQENTRDGTYQVFKLSQDTKLKQAIKAGQALIDDRRLTLEDKLTVIHFDDKGKTLLPLTTLSNNNKRDAYQAINELERYSGGTQMSQGMLCAQKELSKLPPQVAKRVLILTDGRTFDESECESLAPQFAESNTPLITIGIGEDYNEELLLKLSEISLGRPYHLQEISQLSEIFEQEVGSTVKEVVTDLQATISTVKGVKLESITRVYPSLSPVDIINSKKCMLGNIIAGDYTVFVLELIVSKIERPPSRVRIAQLGLVGNAPALNRREEFPVLDLFVEFTTDKEAWGDVDEEVLGYVQQKNLDCMIQDAVQQAPVNPQKARQTLQMAQNITKIQGNSAVTKMLDNAVDEFNKTGKISSNTTKTIRAGSRTKTIKV